MPWDHNRYCEWSARNVRRQVAAEEPPEQTPEPPQGDLIAVIVRALAPFETAREAVYEALRLYGGIALCPG